MHSMHAYWIKLHLKSEGKVFRMLSARKEFLFYHWVMLDIVWWKIWNDFGSKIKNVQFLSIALEWTLKLNEKVSSCMKLKGNFERFPHEIFNWLLNNDKKKMLKLNVFVKWFVVFYAISFLCKCFSIHLSRTKPSITVAFPLFRLLNSIHINI